MNIFFPLFLGVVEHRYSDFLSLYNHLQRVFAPPFYSYPPFPKKERFVLMSERDQLADHRLSIFKDFVKVMRKEVCQYLRFS